jgi:hypothetical protein
MVLGIHAISDDVEFLAKFEALDTGELRRGRENSDLRCDRSRNAFVQARTDLLRTRSFTIWIFSASKLAFMLAALMMAMCGDSCGRTGVGVEGG